MMRLKQRQHYYATGSNTKVCKKFPNDYYIEYNSSIKMWRLNHKKGLPLPLFGYTPHYKALVKSFKLWYKQNASN